MNLKNLIQYFSTMSVSKHDINSLFGFFIFITIAFQILSGIMLSFSLLPEPMLIPMVRDEEDLEDLYIEDFFWLHERGVDLIFIFSYFHLFRKIYLNVFNIENEAAWKSGVFSFMVFQVVVFLGLILCCSHLSEITLTIAANVMHTFFLFYGKFYWWLFTDKQLNTDTLLRLAYAHYLSAFYLAYLGLLHGIDMHYDWKNESCYDGIEMELVWFDEALANELSGTIDILLMISLVCFMWYADPESLTYEIFMWGDLGLVTDIRFYGVAPHWYFRPFMAWLIVCPYHKTGVFGLLFFFFILFNQPTINGLNEQSYFYKKKLLFLSLFIKTDSVYTTNYLNNEYNLYYIFFFYLFLMCCLYTSSFLPYGKYYNRLGGNPGMLGAYMFVYVYLAFYFFRKPVFLELLLYSLFLKARRLR